MGYADGYLRTGSGKAQVLLGGVKAPVLGPAAAQMVKVMGRYRYHLTIRAKDCARWRRLISGVLREFMQDGKNRGVTVFADSNNEM